MKRFFKSAAFPILLVVILAFVAQRVSSPDSGDKPPTYNEFLTMVDKGEIELAGDVIETALNGLKPGDPAEIAVAGVGPVTGKLRLLPASVDPMTRLGLARIALDPDPRLRVGLFAQGWIVTERREALTVPLTAILADAKGERVQVVRNGVVETRPVRGGLIWQGRREVLEGLKPGEQVVARAGAFFADGDRLRVAP